VRNNTKIIATLGPASSERAVLARLLDAGVDICRLNFSHGDLESHGRTLATIRALAAERGEPVCVFGDLCGPKIRLGKFASEPVTVRSGDMVRLIGGDGVCEPGRLFVSYPRLNREVAPGERIFIDDGLIRLVAREQKGGDELICEVVVGGELRSRKGVNLPDTVLSTPALTDKDRIDVQWAVAHGLDYVALSFVRRPEDLYELKRLIKSLRGDLPVIIKIEKTEALEHLGELIEHTDAVLVARGDLGVETDVWRVPVIQHDLVSRCRHAGVPVIVATQMLQSMVDSPMPTRAEVSDVATAVFEQADAVMLSGETAVGRYPVEAVTMMNNVALAAAEYLAWRKPAPLDATIAVRFQSASAVAHAAVRAALDLGARLVAVWTVSGQTVRMVAQHRLPMPVVGLTADETVWRRMSLLYGVVPLRVPPIDNPAAIVSVLSRALLEQKLAAAGDQIVVVASTHPTISGETNTVLVHRVGAEARLSPGWPAI
jgi:pyruvate kinase